jgi:hypothetical protein
MAAEDAIPLEAPLLRLFRKLGIERAHVAARIDADWQGFAATNGDRIASLSLLCPTALDPRAAMPMAPRLLSDRRRSRRSGGTGTDGVGEYGVRIASLRRGPKPAAVDNYASCCSG